MTAALAGLRLGDDRTVVTGAAAGAVIGLLAAVAPLPALGLAAALLAAAGVLALGRRSARAFLATLAGLLVVYAFMGKGGAYIGVAPVYVSEVVLALGLLTLLANLRRLRVGVTELLLVAFMAWGAARTLPYVSQYGIDAFRDAVTWGYGAFALIVAALVARRDILAIVRGYRWFVAAFALLMPVIGIVTKLFDSLIPRWPNTPLGGVPILFFNHGHTGVHAAGVAAFVLLGLYTLRGRTRPLAEAIVWLGWLATVGIVGSLNRASLIAASTGALALGVVRSVRRSLAPAIVMPLVLVALILVNPVFDLGAVRKVSFNQLLDNIGSVFGSSSDPDLESTAAWRLAWWNDIIGYTVDGPYFWDGKGYGINLADADGFQVNWDGSLRAPHNGHLEILARSGVPGLTLWILFQASYVLRLLRGMWFARGHRHPLWLRIETWLLIYWLAAMINLSFDPYLEGPHGGIWFWSLVGLGLATTRLAPLRGGREPVHDTATAAAHPLRVRPEAAGVAAGG